MEVVEAYILSSGKITFDEDIAKKKSNRKWDYSGHYPDNRAPAEKVVVIKCSKGVFLLGSPLTIVGHEA